jgi:hypothetical protein
VNVAPLARSVLRGMLVGCVLLAAFSIRVISAAATELRAGDEYRARGELEEAVVHYRRSARWYAPGSPFHVRALSHLNAIGFDAEHRGDTELALSAYRAIRGAIMSARSFYVPEKARLQVTDLRIAALMADLPVPPMDANKSRETLRREHLALLEANHDPSVPFTILLLLGFLLWVGSGFAFTMLAIDEDNRFVPREALRWGGLIVLGLVAFVLGLSLA